MRHDRDGFGTAMTLMVLLQIAVYVFVGWVIVKCMQHWGVI